MKILFTVLLLFIVNVFGYKTIIDVLSEQDRFSTLISSLQREKLITLVNKLESATLFAPDNDAFDKFGKNITREALLYHFTRKGLSSDSLYDGQLRETLFVLPGYLGPDNQNGQRIKITKNNKDKIYVNQAKLIEADISVNNLTVIQVIDRVLEPPTLLGDTIKTRNKVIYDLMESTDIKQLLNKKQPFTVILSTNIEPLNKFNTIESTYLQSKYGREDLATFFKYTIIDKVIFMDDFHSGKTTYKSLSGDSLLISKDKKAITVNDIPIVQSDIIAANGVIHEVDESFKPDSISFNTRKYMYGGNATHMVELFDKFDLGEYVDQTKDSFTILVPPNDAINATLISKSWLSYHIINGSWPQDKLTDNLLLPTAFKSEDLGNHHQRVPVSVENEDVYIAGSSGHSIQFDRARVVGETVNIHDDIIYQISEPLTLPGDILGKLVVDLDLSTFIATLYVSEVVEEIKNTKGLTLFVPTNEAFQNLGLVAKYLVHPSAKSQLQNVLRYHAATDLLYRDTMLSGVHEVMTLANSTLRISQNDSGSVIVGRPQGSGAVLTHFDTLVDNGVIHKISDVQIPNQVKITNKDLLVGIESRTMIQILEKTNLLDQINADNMVVLAPSDKAFSHVDLDYLFENPYELERLAKLHIIPRPWQDRWIISSSSPSVDKSEYPTLLSEDDKVRIRENEKGELAIEVKNGGDSDVARVTGLGRVSAGGGVIAIDSVLTPIRRGFFGLPWIWSLVVTLTIIVMTGGVVSIIGFFGYKIYNRRRLGYRPIH